MQPISDSGGIMKLSTFVIGAPENILKKISNNTFAQSTVADEMTLRAAARAEQHHVCSSSYETHFLGVHPLVNIKTCILNA